MSIEPFNYCRNMARQFMATIQNNLGDKELLSHVLDLYTASTKFMLPDEGRILDDPSFKALNPAEPLKLPYPFIALEFPNHNPNIQPGQTPSSKRIIFARERENTIVVTVVPFFDKYGKWVVFPECFIPIVNYLDRTLHDKDGNVAIAIYGSNQIIRDNCADEIGCLLNFLNALQCSNIHIEKVLSNKKEKKHKIKSALPFDSYHILTVDTNKTLGESHGLGGTHRSPREHMRRGHIRHYSTGLKIWINSMVVNYGKQGGKITKDYLIKSQGTK